MLTIEAEIIEKEVIEVIVEICATLKIDVNIDKECYPGTLIKSQVLLSAISIIEESLNIKIPNDCYIFSEKNQKQLSIQETVQKIIKVAKHEKQK